MEIKKNNEGLKHNYHEFMFLMFLRRFDHPRKWKSKI